MALEKELQTSREKLPQLLKNSENCGKYVLIHGDKVEGVWATVDDALMAGYDAFGIEPFLVKEITEHEKPRYFSHQVRRCH